jgi:hypothetical protein
MGDASNRTETPLVLLMARAAAGVRTTTLLAVFVALRCLQAANARESPQPPTKAVGALAGSAQPETPAAVESNSAGIGITLDEHLLTDPRRDRDFDGGGEVILSGTSARYAGLFLVPHSISSTACGASPRPRPARSIVAARRSRPAS